MGYRGGAEPVHTASLGFDDDGCEWWKNLLSEGYNGPRWREKRLRIIKNGFHNPAAAEIFNSVTILRWF